MLQSSITAWLKKPASILKPDESAAPRPKPQSITAALAQPTVQQDARSSKASTRTAEDGTAPSFEQSSPPANSTIPPTFKPTPLPPLPPNVELVPLTEDLVAAYKRLNTVTLPVAYPAAFYKETLQDPVVHGLTLLALWHSVPRSPKTSVLKPPTHSPVCDALNPKPTVIGAIRCRMLESPTPALYISTLSLLSPYRSYGIATHLLQRVTVKAVQEHDARSVMAHVWEKNDEGLEWYKKRGFEVVGKEEAYYRKLRPAGAMLVQKRVAVGDFLGMDCDSARS